MRPISRLVLLSGFPLALAACGDQPLSPSLLTGGGGCSPQYVASIAPPIQPDGSSVFQIPSTIPFKIRVTDCETGAEVNSLTPSFSLDRLDGDGAVIAVVEVINSSSNVDVGTTLRSAGNGQYLFNFSTKLSEIDEDSNLVPGRYRLTVWGAGQFNDVIVEFQLK